MFDAKLRPLINPPLNAMGVLLARIGFKANAVTFIGLIFGLIAAFFITQEDFIFALFFILLNRLCDGLDGAVARATEKTNFGGYLDIVTDFIFYVSIPLAFAFITPENIIYSLLLISSFTITGVSFLAFAAIAAEKGIETTAHGEKSFFYSTGLAEGTETILFFIVICLLPQYFIPLASLYTALCVITVIQRSIYAYLTFKKS